VEDLAALETNDPEAEMQLAREKGIATLSVFVVVAGIALLVRLIQREQRRRSMRDTAIETLRESGEHFLPAPEVDLTTS
jgi:L-asparagine transporter-like permease